MYAKNTKLKAMRDSLTKIYNIQDKRQSSIIDPQFYNKDRIFVDLVKQTTLEDAALPYDHIPKEHEVEVFLQKRCYLKAYSKTQTVLNANSS